jgi:hypothetical protein
MPAFPDDEYDVRSRDFSRSRVGLFVSCLPYAIVTCTLFTTAYADDKSPKVLAQWPIEENGLSATVPVEINGRLLNLEIDTGSNVISVLPLFQFAFKGKATDTPLSSTRFDVNRIAVYKTNGLKIGSVERDPEDICPLNSRSLVLNYQSRGVDGLLSGTALRDYCLQIDYDLQICRILTTYSPDRSDIPLKFTYVNRLPMIHTRVGEYADFLIDTGNQLGFTWSGSISSELIDGRDYVAWRNPVADKTDVSRERILLRSLTIGDSDLQLENVQGMPAETATLGLQVLSQFRMTIDYPNAMLYLAPRKTPHKVLAPDASGIALIRDKRGFYVGVIYDGTPASEAGLKRDDRILTVQGRPATQLTIHELEGLFTQGGKAVTLGLERNGTRFERRLALRFPIEYPPKWPERKTVVRTIPPD